MTTGWEKAAVVAPTLLSLAAIGISIFGIVDAHSADEDQAKAADAATRLAFASNVSLVPANTKTELGRYEIYNANPRPVTDVAVVFRASAAIVPAGSGDAALGPKTCIGSVTVQPGCSEVVLTVGTVKSGRVAAFGTVDDPTVYFTDPDGTSWSHPIGKPPSRRKNVDPRLLIDQKAQQVDFDVSAPTKATC